MKPRLVPWRVLAALVVVLAVALAACSKPPGPSGATASVDYWTCTMHPSVHSKDPGKCPICSMDLVPVVKNGGGDPSNAPRPETGQAGQPAAAAASATETQMDGENPAVPGAGASGFTVPVARQQQIGVTYAVVEKRPLQEVIRAVGMAVPDRTREWEFVARVDGYIQKLEVTSPGERVEKGQSLLTLYSPDLRTAEREFVDLLAARDRSPSPQEKTGITRLIESSKRRLEQWNLTEPQVAELERSRKPTEFLTLYSPFNGVVKEVPVQQGRKVAAGDRLVDVADLSEVWVWAEFYENELRMVQAGEPVMITTDALPGQMFAGKIGLVDPFINEAQRTAKVRIDIPNPELKLRPGMYLNADLMVEAGEGLAIPVSAVMPTGTRSIVFLDKGEGKLEPRTVQLGGKFGDFYQVQGGLKKGERVVASANFLIDAESKVQGALKDFEEPEAPGGTPAPPVQPAAANRAGRHAPLEAFKAALALFQGATLDRARIRFGEASARWVRLLNEDRPAKAAP